jgi:hypothetical protein
MTCVVEHSGQTHKTKDAEGAILASLGWLVTFDWQVENIQGKICLEDQQSESDSISNKRKSLDAPGSLDQEL